jgi:hypothetical protein
MNSLNTSAIENLHRVRTSVHHAALPTKTVKSTGSHGGDYENCVLLGCDAVYAGIMYRRFQGIMLHPSSTPMITVDEDGTKFLTEPRYNCIRKHSATPARHSPSQVVDSQVRHYRYFNIKTHGFSCVRKARIGPECVPGYQMSNSTFRSLRREIKLLEARKQGLRRTSPHFRSQIASEKDMFDRKIMLSYYVQELTNIHHTTQPQCIPKLFHSNLRMNPVLISTFPL